MLSLETRALRKAENPIVAAQEAGYSVPSFMEPTHTNLALLGMDMNRGNLAAGVAAIGLKRAMYCLVAPELIDPTEDTPITKDLVFQVDEDRDSGSLGLCLRPEHTTDPQTMHQLNSSFWLSGIVTQRVLETGQDNYGPQLAGRARAYARVSRAGLAAAAAAFYPALYSHSIILQAAEVASATTALGVALPGFRLMKKSQDPATDIFEDTLDDNKNLSLALKVARKYPVIVPSK